jgi:hypothetical protein
MYLRIEVLEAFLLSLRLNLISNSTAASWIHFDCDDPYDFAFLLLLLLPSFHVRFALSTLFRLPHSNLCYRFPIRRRATTGSTAHTEQQAPPRSSLNPSRLRPGTSKRWSAGLTQPHILILWEDHLITVQCVGGPRQTSKPSLGNSW